MIHEQFGGYTVSSNMEKGKKKEKEKNSRAYCKTLVSLWSSKSFLYSFSLTIYCKEKKFKKKILQHISFSTEGGKKAAFTADGTINSLYLLD